MSGAFTRKMYDSCAIQQDVRQSTNPMEHVMDVHRYINCSGTCKPSICYPQKIPLVDIESQLMGLGQSASNCYINKPPYRKIAEPYFSPPYVCEWGHQGEDTVITTNMKMPQNSGVKPLK
jgi:hypothetical protein